MSIIIDIYCNGTLPVRYWTNIWVILSSFQNGRMLLIGLVNCIHLPLEGRQLRPDGGGHFVCTKIRKLLVKFQFCILFCLTLMDHDAVQAFLDGDVGSHCFQEFGFAQGPATTQKTALCLFESSLNEVHYCLWVVQNNLKDGKISRTFPFTRFSVSPSWGWVSSKLLSELITPRLFFAGLTRSSRFCPSF